MTTKNNIFFMFFVCFVASIFVFVNFFVAVMFFVSVVAYIYNKISLNLVRNSTQN